MWHCCGREDLARKKVFTKSISLFYSGKSLLLTKVCRNRKPQSFLELAFRPKKREQKRQHPKRATTLLEVANEKKAAKNATTVTAVEDATTEKRRNDGEGSNNRKRNDNLFVNKKVKKTPGPVNDHMPYLYEYLTFRKSLKTRHWPVKR